MTKTQLCLAALLALPHTAFAGSLTPWGVTTGSGTAAFTPYIFADPDSVSTSIYVSGGVAKRFDFIGGVSLGYDGSYYNGPVEFIPRYFISPSVGLALRLASTDTALIEVGPELHAVWRAKQFAFTTNVGWRPAIGDEFDPGTAFAVLAPEYFLHESVSVYVEVNPTLTIEDTSFEANIVPGVGFTIGGHGFSLAMIMPTSAPISGASFGGWYSIAWGS